MSLIPLALSFVQPVASKQRKLDTNFHYRTNLVLDSAERAEFK
jgi:hypothetical protein